MCDMMIRINEQELVKKYDGTVVKSYTQLAKGDVIFIFDDNMKHEYIVRDIVGESLLLSEEISTKFNVDIYNFNEETGKFEFMATDDPEDLLEEGLLTEGDIIFIAKPGTKDATYVEGTVLSDIFGIYIVTETVDDYIEECYDIYFDDNDEPEEEGEEEEDGEAVLTFVPLKPFFMWLKDKTEILKLAKKVFQKDEIEFKK